MSELLRFKNGINSETELVALAQKFSANVPSIPKVSPVHLLLAFMTVESSLGKNNIPRYEPGYGRTSIKIKSSKLLLESHNTYGDAAAMSYGPMQIMYIVARELGFSGNPLELTDGNISIPYAVLLLRKNFSGGADSLEKQAATYNAGLGCLLGRNIYPTLYVKKFLSAYSSVQKKFPLSAAPSA